MPANKRLQPTLGSPRAAEARRWTDAEAWRSCAVTMSHKTYAPRYDAFRAALAPALFKALETGDARWGDAVHQSVSVKRKEKTWTQ